MWGPVQVTPAGLESANRVIGRWAIEVAKEYPSARVIGIDLAPTQPEEVPTNCEFVIGDAIVELPEFHDCSTDLINARYISFAVRLSDNHCRFIIMGLRKDQWATYSEEAFRILKPGGYVQTCEVDHFVFESSTESVVMNQFLDYLNRYHDSKDLFNYRDGVTTQHQPVMEAAGFVDIKVHRKSWDHGDWRVGQSPARAAASRACPDAFPTNAYRYIVDNLFGEYIPDPAERRAFGEKVSESIDSGCHFT
jgi:hypothetical protein